MKIFLRNILLIIGVFYLTGCCLYKTHFTDKELIWLSPYSEGDTIIFQSNNGDLDTSWIVQKIIYHANCNPISSHGTHRYHTGRIYYQNSTKNYTSGGKELISIAKYPDRTNLMISYQGNWFILSDIATQLDFGQLTDVEIFADEDIYLFSDKHPLAKPDNIQFLYWHKEYGIIKYITHARVEWKRINMDFEVE
jgi:hypothetical protein